MQELLTTNVATNLYWFGRHLERVEGTLIDVLALFDVIIDTDKEAGKRYFEDLGIALEYDSASEFLDTALFGAHDANLNEIMAYARENAIICRARIETDVFGETIDLHRLFERAANDAHSIDYRFVDDALSLINEIWGNMTRGLERHKSDHFIRLGKLIEKVDLHLRHNKDGESLDEYLERILITARLIAPEAELSLPSGNNEESLAAVNALFDNLIVP